MIDIDHLRSVLNDLNPIYTGGAILAALLLLLTRVVPRSSRPAMTITVKWGREKLRIPIPTPDTKLAVLRSTLAEQTGLPPSSFKLVHAGAVMKDDTAPLAAYGLRRGSKIALIDGAANAPPEKLKEKARPATEEANIAAIRTELELVKNRLAPALELFLNTISPSPSATTTSSAPPPVPADAVSESAPPPQPTVPPGVLPDIEMEHRRLGEELLQALLRLDVLVLDGAWTSARTERKGAIKSVQTLLDRLDGGWRERKARLAT